MLIVPNTLQRLMTFGKAAERARWSQQHILELTNPGGITGSKKTFN